MNNGNFWLRLFKVIGLALTLAVTMNACGVGSQKWGEEVQLSDGNVLIVERETIHKRGGSEWASNSSGAKPEQRYIRFSSPDGSGKIIEWRTTKVDSQTWPEKPLILDIEGGRTIVFSLVSISTACERYSKYVFQNGLWTEEALPEKIQQRTTNLFIRDGMDMPKLVDLETKRKENSENGYRHSLRQVGPARQVCSL